MNAFLQHRQITNAQSLLLQLFDRDLSENELHDMRRVLTKHFTQKAEAERLLTEKKQTAKDVERDTAAINENRTAYLHRKRSDQS